MKRILVAATCGLFLAPAAFADETAADACAAELTGDARIIYDEVKPHVSEDTDLEETMRTQVQQLVKDKKVPRKMSTRGEARKAGQCLQHLATEVSA